MSDQTADMVPEVNGEFKQPIEHTLYCKLQNMAERVAATRFGQFLLQQSDNMLKSVEYTAKWSLPKDKMQDGQKFRPLSWLPFLVLIVVLRLVRFWLSLAALSIGSSPITAMDMVYFLETRRRKLRSIRLNGLKSIREHELAQSDKQPCGLLQKLYRLLITPMCCSKRLQNNSGDFNVKMLRERWAKAEGHQVLTRQLSQKRSSSKEAELDMATEEEVDKQLSFNELLAKYVDMPSEEDSTYEPPESVDSSELSSDDTETEEEVESLEQKEQLNVVDVESDTLVNRDFNVPKPVKMEINSDTESTQNTRYNGKNETNEHSQANKLDHKSTPGHVSASITKIPQSTNLSNTAAAGEHESNTTQSSPLMIEIPTQNLSNSVAATISTPPFENNRLGSASSCEDIFYSPIGSPTDFNMQPPFNFNSNIGLTENKDLPREVTDKIENIQPSNPITKTEDKKEPQKPSQIKPKYHQNHAQPEQKQNHNRQSSTNNKFRGRNRKKFDAV